MTEIDNDKLLKDFFAENKREIAAASCTTCPTAATGWHAFGLYS